MFLEYLSWTFSAAVGASFYVLFTMHDYVKTRTFDPRYNSLYLIRFVLGVLSGVILAIVLSGKGMWGGNASVSQFGPALIALVGGFSSEAVYQVLQRLVDLLLAAVRGDNSDAAKTQANQAAQQELVSLLQEQGLSKDMQDKISAAIKKFAA